MILSLGGPGLFRTFVGVDHRRSAFRGKADGLFKIFDADFGLGDGRVCREAGQLHTRFRARALDAQRIVEHGNAVKIAGFAEQFAAEMDHGLDVFVAQFRGLRDAPLEGLVIMTDKLKVDTDADFGHGGERLRVEG